MRIDFLTLFPEMFEGVLHSSMLKKAQEKKAVQYGLHNFREYTENKHNRVDNYPYGGGAGMVLSAQPVYDALEAVKKAAGDTKPRIVLLCPQGARYTQGKARELAGEQHLILICGHYEGYDERIREHMVTDEISIGDFVLTGGELGAMVIADSVTRLLPEVLGNEESAQKDSFEGNRLEHPHYTRPAEFRGWKVPDVLLSGHHKNIEAWRQKESLKRTQERRPDLLADETDSENNKK